MTIERFKTSKIVVLSAIVAFLIGSIVGTPFLANLQDSLVEAAYAKGGHKNHKNKKHNNSKKPNKLAQNIVDMPNFDEVEDVNEEEIVDEPVELEKEVTQVEEEETVLEEEPVVLNIGGPVATQPVQNTTVENNNNNDNNNVNNNNVEVNPVIVNTVENVVESNERIVYEDHVVYESPSEVYYTPDTGAGALSFLTLIPGGAVALLRKRIFA